MRRWTAREVFVSTVAYAPQRVRPQLRRIAARKHQPLDGEPDSALIEGEQIIEHLERSRYQGRKRGDVQRRHSSP